MPHNLVMHSYNLSNNSIYALQDLNSDLQKRITSLEIALRDNGFDHNGNQINISSSATGIEMMGMMGMDPVIPSVVTKYLEFKVLELQEENEKIKFECVELRLITEREIKNECDLESIRKDKDVIKSLEEKNERLESIVEQDKLNLDHLERQYEAAIKASQKNNDMSKEKIKKIELDLQAQTEDNNSFTMNNIANGKELQAKMNEIDVLKDQLRSSQNNMDEQNTRLKLKLSLVDQLNEQIEELQNEINCAREQLEESTEAAGTMTDQIKASQKEIDAHRKDIHDLRKSLETKNKRIKLLENEAIDQNNASREEIYVTLKDNERKIECIKTLNARVSSMQNEIFDLRESLETKAKRIKQLENKAIDQRNASQEEIAALNVQISSTQDEVRNLRESLGAKSTRIEELEYEAIILTGDIQHSRNRVTELGQYLIAAKKTEVTGKVEACGEEVQFLTVQEPENNISSEQSNMVHVGKDSSVKELQAEKKQVTQETEEQLKLKGKEQLQAEKVRDTQELEGHTRAQKRDFLKRISDLENDVKSISAKNTDLTFQISSHEAKQEIKEQSLFEILQQVSVLEKDLESAITNNKELFITVESYEEEKALLKISLEENEIIKKRLVKRVDALEENLEMCGSKCAILVSEIKAHEIKETKLKSVNHEKENTLCVVSLNSSDLVVHNLNHSEENFDSPEGKIEEYLYSLVKKAEHHLGQQIPNDIVQGICDALPLKARNNKGESDFSIDWEDLELILEEVLGKEYNVDTWFQIQEAFSAAWETEIDKCYPDLFIDPSLLRKKVS